MVGELISPLRDKGVLIVGGGFSFHDTRGIISGTEKARSATFDRRLKAMLADATQDEAVVELVHSTGCRAAYPREDHLIPLMVTMGLRRERCRRSGLP